MAPSHPGEEQLCSCQVLQTTGADQMGAILVDMCTKLGQFFLSLSLSRAEEMKCTPDTHTAPNHSQPALGELRPNHNQVPAAGSPCSVFFSLSQHRPRGTGCLFSVQQGTVPGRVVCEKQLLVGQDLTLPPFLAERRMD